jgi:hypothetical protein
VAEIAASGARCCALGADAEELRRCGLPCHVQPAEVAPPPELIVSLGSVLVYRYAVKYDLSIYSFKFPYMNTDTRS